MSTPARRRHDIFPQRKGISLVEVLIVLGILSLAASPVFLLFRGQTMQAYQAANLVAGHTLLTECMDRAVSRLHASRFDLAPSRSEPVLHDVTWGKGTMKVEEVVTVRKSNLTEGLWRVDVQLAWDDRRGQETLRKTLTLSRLVADPSVGLDTPPAPPRDATRPAGGDPDSDDLGTPPPFGDVSRDDGLEADSPDSDEAQGGASGTPVVRTEGSAASEWEVAE